MESTMMMYVKLSDRASTPKRESADAAGYDLSSAYDYVVEPKGKCLCQTDLQLALPAGTYGRIGSVGIDLTLGFNKEPSDVIVKRNQPVLLDCSAYSATEPLNVSWYHKGVLLSSDSRRQVFVNGSLYIGHIRRVRSKKRNGGAVGSPNGNAGAAANGGSALGGGEPSDAGPYQCQVTNKVGTLISRVAHLTVPSMQKKFTDDPESVTVEEGDVVQFRCQIQAYPDPVYTWQRDQNSSQEDDLNDQWIDLSQIEDTRFTILPAGALQINGALLDDVGHYRCVAHGFEHNVTSAEAELKVNPATRVYQLPKFLPTESAVVAKVGELVVLECLASGYPKPAIIWTRSVNGKSIQLEPSSMTVGQGNLIIKPVTLNHDGSYVCTATNEHPDTMETKSIYQIVQLRVTMPPDFITRPQNVVGPLGKTTRFECEVQGIPPPVVRWLKDGHPIESFGRIKHKNISSNELVILHTVKADSGIYQCVTENSAGRGWAAARLLVNTSQDQEDAPTGLRAVTRSNSSIEVFWNASSTRNDLTFQAYVLHYYITTGGDEGQTVTVNTSCLVTKLRPFTNYTFYLRAYNDRSASEPSKKITWMTGEDVPIAAPSVTLTSTLTSLHVTWEGLTPLNARGVVVMFKIQYRKRNSGSIAVNEVSGEVREYTITGLHPGKKYDVRVLAATKMGYPNLPDDKWPWVTHEMPDHIGSQVPLSPILELTVINLTAVTAKWKLPKENEYEATGYKLYYRSYQHQSTVEKFWGPINLSSNVSQYLLGDLDPQAFYEVHVLSFNENGDGREAVGVVRTESAVQSDGDHTTIYSVVEPPTQLEAKSTSSTSIRLTWKNPMTNKNISYFTVRYNPLDNNSLVNSSMVSYIRSTTLDVVITDLMAFTQYEFSVRSHDEDNKLGPYSNKVECKTLEDLPTAPQELNWKPLNANTIWLAWQPPKYPNGVIVSYDIMYNTETATQYPLAKWSTIKEKGSHSSATVNGLASNTMYYLCMRAETSVGSGPPTEVISFNIPAHNIRNISTVLPEVEEEMHDPKIGIIVGVSIGVCCMIICALIIICRNRCFPPPTDNTSLHTNQWSNGYGPQVNGNGHVTRDRISSSESHELDSITPMLTNITGTISFHLDTKGGYPTSQCLNKVEQNGGPGNGYSNGHAGGKQLINITENPQFDLHNSDASSGLAPHNQNKRKSPQQGLSDSAVPLLSSDGGSPDQSTSDGTPEGAMSGGSNTSREKLNNVQQTGSQNGINGRHHHNQHHHHQRISGIPGASSDQRRQRGGTKQRHSGGSCSPSDSVPIPQHSSTPNKSSADTIQQPLGPAVVTIPLSSSDVGNNGKHGISKDGRRRRPLSHTAIVATPNHVGSAMQSSAGVVSGQRSSSSPKLSHHGATGATGAPARKGGHGKSEANAINGQVLQQPQPTLQQQSSSVLSPPILSTLSSSSPSSCSSSSSSSTSEHTVKRSAAQGAGTGGVGNSQKCSATSPLLSAT